MTCISPEAGRDVGHTSAVPVSRVRWVGPAVVGTALAGPGQSQPLRACNVSRGWTGVGGASEERLSSAGSRTGLLVSTGSPGSAWQGRARQMLLLHHVPPEILLFSSSSRREQTPGLCLAACPFLQAGLLFITVWPHRGCREYNFTASERCRNSVSCFLLHLIFKQF